MNQNAMNMSAVKRKNIHIILKTLLSNGPMSRKDIAHYIGLTPAAVTILVSDLIKLGLMNEVGHLEEEKRVGRKKILVDVNYAYKYVVGVNMESDDLSIGVGTLKGDILYKEHLDLSTYHSPHKYLEELALRIDNMLNHMSLQKNQIASIGVGIVGPVNQDKGISKEAYGIWKEEVNIKEELQNMLHISVVVENNVRALALAQLHQKTYQHMLFIKYGPGIGSALILGDDIYYGSTGTAGEIGHMLIKENGPLCKCGKEGCLEALIASDRIEDKVKAFFSEDKTPELFKVTRGQKACISMRLIVEAAIKGDSQLFRMVEEMVNFMVQGIYNAFVTYDPHCLVLCGKIFSYDPFTRLVEERILKIGGKEMRKRIEVSQLMHLDPCIGGITLAMNHFYNQGFL